MKKERNIEDFEKPQGTPKLEGYSRFTILRFVLYALLFLFFVYSADAKFLYNNQSIIKDYSGGDSIRGNFNLTFESHPANSIFTSNFPGEITLSDLVRKSQFSEGQDYNCTVKGCTGDFSAKGELSNSFSTASNEKKLIGFNLNGEDASVQSIRLKINSDSPASCYGQIGIDVLDNYTYAFRNTKFIDEKCGIRYSGCFSESANPENAELTGNSNGPYCEKITLPAAPAYKIGAKIYNSTKNTNAPITAEIYNMDWSLLGSCTFPNHTMHFEELKCLVALPRNSQGDYLACISAKSGVESNYTVPSEQTSPACGNAERGSKEYSRDYFIFAEALMYDSANLELNESNFNKITGNSLVSTVNGYIEERYNSDCRRGCTVPLPILSSIGQNVNILDAEIKYTTKGTLITGNKIFSLENRNSSLTSGPLALNISHAKFTIPRTSKDSQFSLFLDGERVYNPIKISLKSSFDFDLQPKTAAIGFQTLFKIIMPDNVSSVSWNFGDGPAQSSPGKNISHIFKEQKKFEIEISATRDKDGVTSTRKFEVEIMGAKESSKKLLDETEKKTGDIEKEISSYPQWISKEIEKRVNTSDMKSRINEIKAAQAKATKDEEHVKIIQDLLALAIPVSVTTNVRGEEPLITGLANAELGFIKNISGASSADNEMIKKELLAWTEENYQANVEREVISLYNGVVYAPIATKFSIKLVKKGEGDAPAYLIIAIPKNHIIFDKGYGERQIKTENDEGIVISIANSNTVSFIVPEDISLASVGAYLSPDIKRLVKDIEVNPPKEPLKRGKWATLWIILLAIGVLIIYIILQEWYKKRYESHLFPSKDDLYNIINFIYNARSNGLTDDDIRNKLREAGWKGEQITYAMKKIDGKMTGIWEIPLFKFKENRKVKEEIERRQGKPLDTSFIKRPSF